MLEYQIHAKVHKIVQVNMFVFLDYVNVNVKNKTIVHKENVVKMMFV